MAIDPICGMTVNEATARSAERDGKTIFFCSEHCRQKFLGSEPKEKPHTIPHRSLALQRHTAEKYTCPMHPEVQSEKPGSCPKCGMALEPSRPAAQKQKVIYTCPMHPEVERDGPGTCPKCGMALEPKTVQPDHEEDDSELRSMTRRFWVGLVLTVPVLLMAMLPMLGVPVDRWLGAELLPWLQLALSTPVVLWGGWPFFERGWRSVVHRSVLTARTTGRPEWPSCTRPPKERLKRQPIPFLCIAWRMI